MALGRVVGQRKSRVFKSALHAAGTFPCFSIPRQRQRISEHTERFMHVGNEYAAQKPAMVPSLPSARHTNARVWHLEAATPTRRRRYLQRS
jgi:hypothetical protein